jgi:hypothetical protein
MGEGCKDVECTALFIERAMLSEIENYGVGVGVGVGGSSSGSSDSSDSSDNKMTRNGLLRVSGIERTSSTSTIESLLDKSNANSIETINAYNSQYSKSKGEVRSYGKVPCIPPYCDFECLKAYDDDVCSIAVPGISDLINEINADVNEIRPRNCPDANGHDRMFLPISIGLHPSSIVSCVPVKHSVFASQGYFGSYAFNSMEEGEYKRSYRRSYYAVSGRKSGWDCLRHYEILGSGSVTYFEGIDGIPSGTMRNYPKKLVSRLMSLLDEVEVRAEADRDDMSKYDMSKFNHVAYSCLSYALLEYTTANLSNVAHARYMLRSVGINIDEATADGDSFKVLFLGGNDDVDYVRDMLLVGFKTLARSYPGMEVVDFVRPRHLYWSDSTSVKDWNNDGLYGLGYTYTRWLDSRDDMVFRGDIRSRIVESEFDLIVYGSVHRGMPFVDDVVSAYDKSKIVFVDGEDTHGWECSKVREYAGKGWYFMREMEDGCPR